MKNKKGFTLIELLAVIIILGILMIIAIPSVTKYISDSRDSAYIDTAKEIIGATRNFINEGKISVYNTDVTYYVDVNCIKTENANRSPYGEFKKAYVGVTYDGNGYNYYWTSVDDTGHGIKEILMDEDLNEDKILSDVKESDIDITKKLEDNSKYSIIDETCTPQDPQEVYVEPTCTPSNISVTIAKDPPWPSVMTVGDVVSIKATVTGLCPYNETKLVWKYKLSDGSWHNIDPAVDTEYFVTEDGYRLNIYANSPEILGRAVRVTLYYR